MLLCLQTHRGVMSLQKLFPLPEGKPQSFANLASRQFTLCIALQKECL